MGFWRSLFGRGGDSRHVGYQDPAPNLETAAVVTFDTAMSVSAFWASSRLLSETVAAMPLRCYKTNPDTGIKEPYNDYELFKLMKYRPNRFQTTTEFFESLMLGLVTCGNAYIVPQKMQSTGRIVGLLPLVSSQMTPYLTESGALEYKYTTANGQQQVYLEDEVWHIKLFGNGLIGLSPLGYAAKSLGLAIAADNTLASLSKNGGKSSGVIKFPSQLKPEQREQARKNAKDIASGGNGLYVLEMGMEYQQISLSPSDMELLESRRFQIEDIARFMGVPSSLINDTSATTAWGSGIEQINQGFYKLNLRPYLERIESSIKRWLMPESDWETVSIEFDFDALLRADKDTRTKTQSTAINAGIMSPNEARAVEGMPAKHGGDDIYLNGSLVPAGQPKKEVNIGANNGN